MDCGQYSETCKNLMWYRELAPPESDRSFQALWGLFAAQILDTQELVKVIKQEKESYSDPITRMLQCLYVDFDLEGAQEELSKCESLLKSDYFLAQNAFANEFVMCSRKMIFTKYCLIHQKIDMHKLAGQLRMSFEEFEKWMVDLIRSQRRSESNAQLDDAKIDTERGIAILEVRYPSIYERIIQKTEDLTYRSYELAGNLSKARLK